MYFTSQPSYAPSYLSIINSPHLSYSSLESRISDSYQTTVTQNPSSLTTQNSLYTSRTSPISYEPMIPHEPKGITTHSKISYSLFPSHTEYHFIPDNFLNTENQGNFINTSEEVKEYVEETFEKMFHLPFPKEFRIQILNEQDFRKIAPSPGTIGLSINRSTYGLTSDIYILHGTLARVLLTIGHELGHVLTPTLHNSHDEEAKAYAFSMEWIKTIQNHNIANLQNSFITENPAQNGLHNVAFNFVHRLQQQGKALWEIYLELIQKNLTISTLATT